MHASFGEMPHQIRDEACHRGGRAIWCEGAALGAGVSADQGSQGRGVLQLLLLSNPHTIKSHLWWCQ